VHRIARQRRQEQAQESNQEEKSKVEDLAYQPMNTERELLCSTYEKPFCGPTNGVHFTMLAQAVEKVSDGAWGQLKRLGDGSWRLALLQALPKGPTQGKRNRSSHDKTSAR
jgi:hypothetical protein